jgi:hypothetical protein
MADKTKLTKARCAWSVKEEPDKPGQYICDIDGYDGYLQFPHPFMLNHLKAWWEAGVDPLKELESIEWKYWGIEWVGAKLLLLDYGEWTVKGVSQGDIKADNIPAVIEEWVIACAKDFILPQLDPKKRLVLLTVL